MKAQLTVQYLASFIFFIGLVVYVYFAYSANLPKYVEEVEKEDTRSKAYLLSELLINNPGEPSNWDEVPPQNWKRLGFADQHNFNGNLILKSKIDKFNEEFDCSDRSNFTKLQKLVGIDRPFSFFLFNISWEDGSGNRFPLIECIPPMIIKKEINVTMKRIVAYNDSGTLRVAELILQM